METRDLDFKHSSVRKVKSLLEEEEGDCGGGGGGCSTIKLQTSAILRLVGCGSDAPARCSARKLPCLNRE
jgi:hypothetical protein